MEEIVAEIFSNVPNSPPPHCSCTMFYEITIYKTGNIEIETYSSDRWNGNTPKNIFLKIDDNIPVPEYIIEMFKMIFNSGETYNHHIMYYIKVLQKFKEDYAVMYKTNKLEDNKLNYENVQLKQEIKNLKSLNKSYKYFDKTTIREENEQFKLQIEELKKENEQFKLQIEELKKENETLKLQIKGTKINDIINYYC